MASIKFIRDTSETFATANGGRQVKKISKGTVRENIKQSSANWWVNKGDAVHLTNNGRPAAPAPWAPPLEDPAGNPFVEIRQALEDGDVERLYAAMSEVSAEQIDELHNVTNDAKMVLTTALEEFKATGSIDTVPQPDLIDAAREAAEAGKAPAPAVPALPGVPALPQAPKGRGAGRKKAG